MYFPGLETILLGLFFVAAGAAILMAIITVAAIIECVFEYWEDADGEILVIPPDASSELEKIANDHATKKHKKYVYNKETKQALLVESDSISDELRHEEVVSIWV